MGLMSIAHLEVVYRAVFLVVNLALYSTEIHQFAFAPYDSQIVGVGLEVH